MGEAKTHLRWEEVGDGTWILYFGELEAYRARNTEAMTAIMEFSSSPYYHFVIDLNSGVGVYAQDGTKLRYEKGDWVYE